MAEEKKGPKKPKKKKKKQGQTLAYPLPIRGLESEKIKKSLKKWQKYTAVHLEKGYSKEILDCLQEGKKAYKILEPILGNEVDGKKIASRINRGLLEIAGRILRAINDRREAYNIFMEKLGAEPKKWNYQKLIKQEEIYLKSQYVQNLKEQALNFLEKNEKLPDDYIFLQAAPKIKQAMITYAPDDGQAIRYRINEERTLLELEIKIELDQGEKTCWQWVKVELPLPEHLKDKIPVSPDLRLACIHGEWVPVLDYKIEEKIPVYERTKNFITLDWGIRKLLTICVFDREGNQVSTPIFLKFGPLKAKLFRIRKQIDSLKSKRDALEKGSPGWKYYNAKIAQLWRKYRAIQKALSHLAANVIVLVAKLYGASSIYIEWLKGLKSTDKGADLNWWINTTVRQAIFDRVEYKAKLEGIRLQKPINPYYTSQYCPRCGKRGHHVKAPNNPKRCKRGSWFTCSHCGFNADRDYVACCNIARKVLYGNSLSKVSQGIIYRKTPSDSPSRQILLHKRRLVLNLKGWKNSVVFKSQFFSGTLKS